MSKLKLKVCGMREPYNIKWLINLRPDFIGFIFYRKSPRFVSEIDEELMSRIPISIKKVGVFVNEEVSTVIKLYEKYGLDFVQLHGDEDLEFSKKLKERGIGIIKVFRLMESLPYALASFSKFTDYFLFDTASPSYGGSGRHFDWSILENYNLSTPFLLSGGIGLEDVDLVKKLKSIEQLAGIDVNSRFEVKPGLKDIAMIRKLKESI